MNPRYGSHADTALAKQVSPGYCAATCELAERYLAGRADGLRPASGEGLLLARI